MKRKLLSKHANQPNGGSGSCMVMVKSLRPSSSSAAATTLTTQTEKIATRATGGVMDAAVRGSNYAATAAGILDQTGLTLVSVPLIACH